MLDAGRARTGMTCLWDGQVFGRGVDAYREHEKPARNDAVRYVAEIPIEHSAGHRQGLQVQKSDLIGGRIAGLRPLMSRFPIYLKYYN